MPRPFPLPLRSLPFDPASLLPGALRQRIAARLTTLQGPDFTLPAGLARLCARLPQQPPQGVKSNLLQGNLNSIAQAPAQGLT